MSAPDRHTLPMVTNPQDTRLLDALTRLAPKLVTSVNAPLPGVALQGRDGRTYTATAVGWANSDLIPLGWQGQGFMLMAETGDGGPVPIGPLSNFHAHARGGAYPIARSQWLNEMRADGKLRVGDATRFLEDFRRGLAAPDGELVTPLTALAHLIVAHLGRNDRGACRTAQDFVRLGLRESEVVRVLTGLERSGAITSQVSYSAPASRRPGSIVA